LNLTPATPETLDSFIKVAEELLVPVCERLGVRLVIAWFSNHEWFSQVTHLFEFSDIEALKKFRKEANHDTKWGEYNAQLETYAPERRYRLLEPIGAVPPEFLHKAIEESQQKALKVYSLATLEVTPNKMPEFIEGVREYAKMFPIIASLRPIAGNPNEVNDIWKGAIGPRNYSPAVEGMKEWFRNLREMAPKERLVQIFPLPYSELK
jgi:hypothetical protein